MELKQIATIYNDFESKFGIPRQSGLVDAESVIVFEKEYRIDESLRGIEGYSHLWLIWHFSDNKTEWTPTVRPPRLGGNTRVGVFATRSPYRPNPIGLSSVRLLGVEQTKTHGTVLRVAGADILNGTPIFDIKPYIAYTDSHEGAVGGFSDSVRDYEIEVSCPSELVSKLDEKTKSTLIDILKQDPRPSYHDLGREYSFDFAGYKIKFVSEEDTLVVTEIEKED